MTTYRENLIDRMINLYGYENPAVIRFITYCERWENTSRNNMDLENIVHMHEERCKKVLDK